MPSKTLTIINKRGLHARAAAKLTQTAEQFEATISLSKDAIHINAKSIMQVMMLAANQGSQVTIEAEGDDAEQAIIAITQLVNDKFGEGE